MTIAVSNFQNTFITNSVPASNTSDGTPGQFAYNSSSLFICYANNKWGKVALTTSW